MKVHEYTFNSLNGANLRLDRWTGQPLLLVNTASECGYTPQYSKLQSLWTEYQRSGLIIIGIPCNEFGDQEPGTDEDIETFCTERYGVTFPMTTRQSIIGPSPHPLFIAMREEFTSEILPKWNFFKYLFGRDGNLITHFPSKTEPDEPSFRHVVEQNLGAWTL
jgi:glutathione peroxidase